MPFTLTWEQFHPPFKNCPGLLFGGRTLRRSALRPKPVGEGVPFCERYRLHQTSRPAQGGDFTLIVTFEGKAVAALAPDILWVEEAHRRSATGIDLAAELCAARALQRGLDTPVRETVVAMTKASVYASKRAYRLLVERGHIVPPEGYELPS